MIEVVVTDNSGNKEHFALEKSDRVQILRDINEFMTRDKMVLHLITKNKDTFLKSENVKKIEVF